MIYKNIEMENPDQQNILSLDLAQTFWSGFLLSRLDKRVTKYAAS